MLSKNWNGDTCILVKAGTTKVIMKGDVVETSRGKVILTGGNAPHKSSSAGFVYVADEDTDPAFPARYYTSVIDAQWLTMERFAKRLTEELEKEKV